MDLDEKYNLNLDDVIVVKNLPKDPKNYLYILPDDYEDNYSNDKLYINTNGKLKLISYKSSNLYYLFLFLKKYRANPELLPKDLKHEYPLDYMSSEEIYKAMKLMLKPIRTFEEFKERLLLATKELPTLLERWGDSRYGERLVFVNKREDFGSAINIYGEIIPILKSRKYGIYWEEAILFDREKKIFEYWIEPERAKYTPDNSHWKLHIKFYEEQYLYEYLLNLKIHAVRS